MDKVFNNASKINAWLLMLCSLFLFAMSFVWQSDMFIKALFGAVLYLSIHAIKYANKNK